MSDELKKYNFEKYKGNIIVDTNHSLQYVSKQCINADEIVFTVHITNQVLKNWQDLKEETANCFSFVDIPNHFLGEKYAILIKQDSKQIEDHLRRLASSSKANFRGK